MSDALGAQEIWVVSGPTAGEPHPDYACSNREGAMEHAAEASERAPELGPWTVARYVRADLKTLSAMPPYEPTDAMREVARTWADAHDCNVSGLALANLWRAMYDAAMNAPEPKA